MNDEDNSSMDKGYSPSENDGIDHYKEDVEEESSEAIGKEARLSEEIIDRELTIEIKVEIGRLQMSLKDLFQLRPGNTLPLAIKPEEPVRLVHRGKCIARGDLVKIGEVLGVRITQI